MGLFTRLWESTQRIPAAAPIIGGGIATFSSLFAYGVFSASSAEQHATTEQWSAWLAANLTEALNTGNTTFVDYVIGELNKMEEHCVSANADDASRASTLYAFASIFLAATTIYGIAKGYQAIAPRANYQSLNASPS